MVNAQQFYILEESTFKAVTNLFWCEKCKLTGSKSHIDTYCCIPDEIRYPQKPCLVCGESLRHRHEDRFCKMCWTDHKVQGERCEKGFNHEALKLVEEDKIPNHPLALYDEQTDKYFDEVDNFFETWWDESYDSEEYKLRRPKYLFLTDEVTMKIHADEITERVLEEAYEDAYSEITQAEINELQGVLDAWTEKQGIHWYESTTSVILIDWERYEKEYGSRE